MSLPTRATKSMWKGLIRKLPSFSKRDTNTLHLSGLVNLVKTQMTTTGTSLLDGLQKTQELGMLIGPGTGTNCSLRMMRVSAL